MNKRIQRAILTVGKDAWRNMNSAQRTSLLKGGVFEPKVTPVVSPIPSTYVEPSFVQEEVELPELDNIVEIEEDIEEITEVDGNILEDDDTPVDELIEEIDLEDELDSEL